MDSEELTEKICRAHAEYCKSRKNKPVGCAGQTVQNMFSASKCYGCPYCTDYSCIDADDVPEFMIECVLSGLARR